MDDNAVGLVITEIVVLMLDEVVFVVRGVDRVVDGCSEGFVEWPQINVCSNSCKFKTEISIQLDHTGLIKIFWIFL